MARPTTSDRPAPSFGRILAVAVGVSAAFDLGAAVLNEWQCRGGCVAGFAVCLVGSLVLMPLWVAFRLRRWRMRLWECAAAVFLTSGVAFFFVFVGDLALGKGLYGDGDIGFYVAASAFYAPVVTVIGTPIVFLAHQVFGRVTAAWDERRIPKGEAARGGRLGG